MLKVKKRNLLMVFKYFKRILWLWILQSTKPPKVTQITSKLLKWVYEGSIKGKRCSFFIWSYQKVFSKSFHFAMKIIHFWKAVYNMGLGASNKKLFFCIIAKNAPITSCFILSCFTPLRLVLSRLKLLKIGISLSLKIY